MIPAQEEMFMPPAVEVTGGKIVELPRILHRPQRSLQEVLLQESLIAVRLAKDSPDINELRHKFAAALPQNSEVTRLRYADSVIRWFFRDGSRGFAATVWERFQSDELQRAIHRYLYLAAEPIIGTCVAEVLGRLSEGILVPVDYLSAGTAKILGYELSAQTKARLLSNLRKLGFLERSAAGDRIVPPNVDKTALLLALHHAFNVQEPRSIEFSTLSANPFWRFLGLRSEDMLRDFLKEAVHAGYLGKYVVADRLEQITTCLTLSELLGKRVRL